MRTCNAEISDRPRSIGVSQMDRGLGKVETRHDSNGERGWIGVLRGAKNERVSRNDRGGDEVGLNRRTWTGGSSHD